MVVMQVIGLTVDNTTKTPLVVLQDEAGQEILPIWIGAMEAMAISLALSGHSLPRPLTHDLLLSTMGILGGQLAAVEINLLHEGTFHADLLLCQGENSYRVDCRPSDAIALALRVGVPIRVHLDVLRSVSDARQHPNSTHSAKLLTPQDAATDMMRQAAARMTGAQEDSLATETSDKPVMDQDNEGDDKLAELLKMLEPESPRRM